MRPGMSRQDLDDVAAAFEKVWENRSELRQAKSVNDDFSRLNATRSAPTKHNSRL
jgi:hypothetical protein